MLNSKAHDLLFPAGHRFPYAAGWATLAKMEYKTGLESQKVKVLLYSKNEIN